MANEDHRPITIQLLGMFPEETLKKIQVVSSRLDEAVGKIQKPTDTQLVAWGRRKRENVLKKTFGGEDTKVVQQKKAKAEKAKKAGMGG